MPAKAIRSRSFCAFLGKLRRGNERANQAKPWERQSDLFRRGSEEDLHLDGEGLLQAFPQLQAAAGPVADVQRDGPRDGGGAK